MKDAVNKLFSQVVTLLVEMGQITLEEQYIDGTKIESVFCITNNSYLQTYDFFAIPSVFKEKTIYICTRREALAP